MVNNCNLNKLARFLFGFLFGLKFPLRSCYTFISMKMRVKPLPKAITNGSAVYEGSRQKGRSPYWELLQFLILLSVGVYNLWLATKTFLIGEKNLWPDVDVTTGYSYFSNIDLKKISITCFHCIDHQQKKRSSSLTWVENVTSPHLHACTNSLAAPDITFG